MIINVLFTIALFTTIILPLIIYFAGEKSKRRFKRSLAMNIISFVVVFLAGTVLLFVDTAQAAVAATNAVANAVGMGAAAVTISCACFASAYALATSATSALGVLSENDSIFGKALIFVALAEGIALWGFIVAFLILTHVA